MKARMIAAAAALAATVLLVPDAFAAWQSMNSNQGKFTAQFPAKAEYLKQETEVGDGSKLLVHMYGAEADGYAYIVSFNDYKNTTKPEQAQTVLKGVENGIAGSFGGKSVKSGPLPLGKVPGRSMLFRNKEGSMHVRAYLKGARLYQVMVMTPVGKENSPEVTKFFGSFKIIP